MTQSHFTRAADKERGAFYDDRSEDWRDSQKGETFQECSDAVIDLLASLEELGLSSRLSSGGRRQFVPTEERSGGHDANPTD